MTKRTLIEVSVSDSEGNMVPFGIMNSEQAAELSDNSYHKTVAHPAIEDEREPIDFEEV